MNEAQIKAYYEPFEKISGIKVRAFPGSDPTKVKAMVETGNVEWDMAQLSRGSIMNLQKSGDYFEKIDYDIIDPGVDPAYRFEYGLEMLVWAQVLAYRSDQTKGAVPKGWADFWDTKKFPGKRGFRRGPKYALEFALMADGVPPADVYKVLSKPEGVDRAFKKLDELKPNIVWWESGAQPLQLLASGEVVMTTAYNGRISGINKTEGKNFKVVWPGSLYAIDSWVIMKGSPNKEAAMDFIAFANVPENQVKLPEYIAYGLPSKAAAAAVPANLQKDLPTAPENLAGSVPLDADFWIDNIEELNKRFNAWLAK